MAGMGEGSCWLSLEPPKEGRSLQELTHLYFSWTKPKKPKGMMVVPLKIPTNAMVKTMVFLGGYRNQVWRS